jgi:hypothetical protein
VEQERLVERPLIKRAALEPRIIAAAPEILVARVLHHDQALHVIMKKHDRNPHTDVAQEACDRHVMPVLRTVLPVPHENE